MGARNSSVGPGTGAPSTTDSRRSTEAVASTGSAIAAAATGTPAAILESVHNNTNKEHAKQDNVSVNQIASRLSHGVVLTNFVQVRSN